MLPNLSLVMEFLGNVFTNFIFEKFLLHEALVTGRVCGRPLLKEANHHTFRTIPQQHWSIGMSMARPS